MHKKSDDVDLQYCSLESFAQSVTVIPYFYWQNYVVMALKNWENNTEKMLIFHVDRDAKFSSNLTNCVFYFLFFSHNYGNYDIYFISCYCFD